MNPQGAVAERHVWGVTELVHAARATLWDAFPFVWVRGEVSGFTRSSAGHWYLDLKDEQSVLRVAMFRADNEQVPFAVETGLEVVVGGELSIYPARSQFQVIARFLEPVGWGALQLAFEQLKARLAQEGLFDRARKRPLPLLPRCVGVVTSPTGAAWRDMWRVWRSNEVPLRIILAPTRVQGSGAASEIAAAIERLNRHREAEVMIVGRGGGSREDLWAFNEEPVARAIAASRIPVVSAVGHEIDQTIADLVADVRAATPTAAAERVAPSRERLLARLQFDIRRAHDGLARRIASRRARLAEPRLQRSLQQPGRLLTVYRQKLDETFAGLRQACYRALAARQTRLAAVVGRIEALSPLAVLARGYAICERDGAIVRRAGDVDVGDLVRVRLARGALYCRVESSSEVADDASVPPAAV